MRRSGIPAVHLAAALTVTAVVAASAAAEAPEYGRCVNVAKLGKVGAFKNSGCTVKATATEHKFEWQPGPGSKPKFVSHMTSEKATIETASGTKVSCTKMHDAGEVTGRKTTVIQFTFEGCSFSELPCTTPGQAGGVVATPVLPGRLIVIKKEAEAKKNIIGDDIGSPGAPFAEFTCGEDVGFRIVGSVIQRLAVNTMLEKVALVFAETKGHQKLEKGEGEPKDVLETSILGRPFEQTGLALTEVQENERKIEVNTVV